MFAAEIAEWESRLDGGAQFTGQARRAFEETGRQYLLPGEVLQPVHLLLWMLAQRNTEAGFMLETGDLLRRPRDRGRMKAWLEQASGARRLTERADGGNQASVSSGVDRAVADAIAYANRTCAGYLGTGLLLIGLLQTATGDVARLAAEFEVDVEDTGFAFAGIYGVNEDTGMSYSGGPWGWIRKD